MTFLPKNYGEFWTLGGEVSRKGIGLHSGNQVEVHLLPSDEIGFHVSWVNSFDAPIKLQADQVRDSQLCTTLDLGDFRLSTVEHLLAALAGCGLTHVHIKVSGQEIPLLDGSALAWVEAIQEVGLINVSGSGRFPLAIKKPLIFYRGDSVITATPSEKFSLVGLIDFPHKAIGFQALTIELTPETFVKEIASARTFGFLDQVEKLRNQGLIKGGGLDNALVCDGDGWVNPPLRFDDEPVRHKLLDLIGDLALVGFPNAQVLVYKGSHGLHADLATALQTLSKNS